MAVVKFVPPKTREDVEKIAVERALWAEEARAKDLHGSANEWELTAFLARQLLLSWGVNETK